MITLINWRDFDSEEYVTFAFEKAKKMVLENDMYNRFNMSVNDRIKNAMLWIVWELWFQLFLSKIWINYELDDTDFTNHNSDEFDVKIWDFIIDVKVAKKSTKFSPNIKWMYGYPVNQNPWKKDYIVVGYVVVKDHIIEEISFYGWIYGNTVLEYPTSMVNSYSWQSYKTLNYEIPWWDLNWNFAQFLQ